MWVTWKRVEIFSGEHRMHTVGQHTVHTHCFYTVNLPVSRYMSVHRPSLILILQHADHHYAGLSSRIFLPSTFVHRPLKISNMPVIPPWPPFLASRSASSDLPSSSDATKNVHKTSIIAGVLVGLLAFIFVARLVYTIGRPWYLNRRAAKIAREKRLSHQRLWYKSCRPVHRDPPISAKPIELQNMAKAVQYPRPLIQPGPSFVPHEVPLPPTRESCQAIESDAIFVVAVPVVLSASGSPNEIYTGCREFIEADPVKPFIVENEKNIAVYNGEYVGLGNSTY